MMSGLPSLYNRNTMPDESQIGGTFSGGFLPQLDLHLADSSAEGSDPNLDEPEGSEYKEDDNSNEDVNEDDNEDEDSDVRPPKRRRERHRNPQRGPAREDPCLGCYRRMADKGPSHPCLEQSSILATACYDCARIGRKCIPPPDRALPLGRDIQEATLRNLKGEPNPNWEDLARKAKKAIRNYVPDNSSVANRQRTGPEVIPRSIAPAPRTLLSSTSPTPDTLLHMTMPQGFLAPQGPVPQGIATPQSTPAPQSSMVPRTAQPFPATMTIPRHTNLESIMTRVADGLDMNNRLLRQLIVNSAESSNRMVNVVQEIGAGVDYTNRLTHQILQEVGALIGGAGPEDLSSSQ